MSKTYRDRTPHQSYLFPPSPRDWLPEGDLVYFLLDTVATLDLTPIFAHTSANSAASRRSIPA